MGRPLRSLKFLTIDAVISAICPHDSYFSITHPPTGMENQPESGGDIAYKPAGDNESSSPAL
jgi:hypothetical protein